MVNIVFVGNKDNSRVKILKNIPDTKIHVIGDLTKLPSVVIDLFVVDRTNLTYHCINCDYCQTIKLNNKLKHIPIISLVNSYHIQTTSYINCDLMVSELVSDIEFNNYVNTIIKMKLMDDELKKEKIVLELKVKERTLELQNKADKLNITMNSIGDGVIVTDVKGKIVSINPAVEEMCDVKEEDIINKNINKFFNFYIDNNKVDVFEIVKNTNQIYKLPFNSLLKTKNTTLRISDSASPIFDKDGKFNGLVIVFHDITDEYEMRNILIKSEKKYKRLYDNIPDIIYTLDLNGYFTSVNDAVNQLGYTTDEVIGKHISHFIINKEELIISNTHLENKKKGFDLISKYNVDVRCKDGTKRIVELKTHLIEMDDTQEIFVIARDITNLKKVQQDLRIAKENAEKSNNMKTEFISNMTHEIKTPLNSILGFSNIISEKVKSPQLKEYVDMITNSGKKLSDLIEKIIDIADISSGALKIFKKEFSINKMLKEIQNEGLLELTKRNKDNVNLLLIENDDDILYYGDNRRLKQIISEIVLNSIKFTNNGHIKYGYDIEDDFITFYIHDSGIGIDEKNLELVFNSFYQVDRQKQKNQEGLGLGLSLCKALVVLFKGNIQIESMHGIGTTVSIKLPVEKEDVDTEEEYEINSISTENKKVLLIVENNETYGLLQLILLSQSFEIERSIGYIDSINNLKDNKYDLIIIDVNNLPYNGFDFLDWMRINNINTPYIISSNVKDDYTKWIINNPINTSELLDIIKKIFE